MAIKQSGKLCIVAADNPVTSPYAGEQQRANKSVYRHYGAKYGKEIMMKSIAAVVLVTLLNLAAVPYVFAGDAHHASASASENADAAMSDGEVKKVDKDAGKITIKHGPLANLDMPAMTMIFRVKDPAMLDQAKAGDKIRFVAEKINGAITVTKLEQAK